MGYIQCPVQFKAKNVKCPPIFGHGIKFTTKIDKGVLNKDNIVMERFWRSYKWEFVYLMEKMELKELKEKTKQWVEYYNRVRCSPIFGQ